MRRPGQLVTLLLLVFACGLAYAVVSAWNQPVSLPRNVPVKEKSGQTQSEKPKVQPKSAQAPYPVPRPLFRPDRTPFREGNGTQTMPKRDYAAEAAKYVLVGVTVLPDGAKALIRKEPKDRFEVEEGDLLEIFRVVEVTEGSVTLSADNQTVSLKMRAPVPSDRTPAGSAQKERTPAASIPSPGIVQNQKSQKERPLPTPVFPPGTLPPPLPPSTTPYPTPPARRM